jgi:hypothetical protein
MKRLTGTLDEFYHSAWKSEKTDEKGLKLFFSKSIFGCEEKIVLEDFYKWKKLKNIRNQDKQNLDLPRMVNVGFQIKDSTLSHKYDLDCFSEHVNGLFKLYMDGNTRESLVGPYFCFVQSSGMGKTKILWEYKQLSRQNHEVDSFLIVPKSALGNTKKDDTGVFDYLLDLESVVKNAAKEPVSIEITKEEKQEKVQETAVAVAHQIFGLLDQMLIKLKGMRGNALCKKVALLFDESQKLLKEELGYKAFLFRCVRTWLREKRSPLTIVAVFTGTNSKLTNFLFETDEELNLPSERASSRDFQLPVNETIEYYQNGAILYPPFYQTTTLGSCLSLLPQIPGLSEYDRAVYHGRPLFALMAKENVLEKNIQTVLLRMLCSQKWELATGDKWEEQTQTTREAQSKIAVEEQGEQAKTPQVWTEVIWAFISLLSTRVQMGQTTAEVASELVANGYANFCGYIPGSKTILLGYLPDPVCARLAMCMMDETFEQAVTIRSKTSSIIGQRKGWWASRLQEIFSSGIVTPDKGNFGEVVVALYMLFCGDLYREKSIDYMDKHIQRYSQFSVSLDDWFQMMLSGGDYPAKPGTQEMEDRVTVGFIQVCRNSLRSYTYSWMILKDQHFLKHVYESGIAFYTCNKCPIIDMVVPLRIRREGGNEKGDDGCSNEFEYAPMLVSIKCHATFSQSEAETECQKMKERALKDNLDKALCLLVVFGSKETAPFNDMETTEKEVNKTAIVESEFTNKETLKGKKTPKREKETQRI